MASGHAFLCSWTTFPAAREQLAAREHSAALVGRSRRHSPPAAKAVAVLPEDAAVSIAQGAMLALDVPQVNSSYPELWPSENMLRFQAFLSMAFGAEQIDWACWSRVAAN